jgi:uncharacterized protein DUF1501
MRRRKFLRIAGAGVAAAAALSLAPRRARSAPFGQFPPGAVARMLPAEVQAKNVLELYLYGGLSQWESLYMVEEYGRPDDPQYPVEQFYGSVDDVQTFLSSCGLPTTELSRPFATDALGANVRLGPFARPLWGRPDVTARMRLLVQRHDVDPHEAAIPLALTGKRVGNPLMAGLGSHIQRYFSQSASPERKAPFAYMLKRSASEDSDAALDAAVTTGAHPGSARPLRINVDGAGRLGELLARPGAGTREERAQVDALLATYVDQYQRRLRWKGQGEPLRSPRVGELASAVGSVANADAVAAMIEPSLLTPLPGLVCDAETPDNVPAMSLRMAAHLLTHPTQPARYVCVVDSGIVATPAGGYDTHYSALGQGYNLHNALERLLAIINAPGEDDPRKLKLDDTLIIINTEFGRTPRADDLGDKRNHHPAAYVTAMIGGPITTAQAGVSGAIGPNGLATSPIAPGENRIGALLALGIYPFQPEAFAVSDAPGATAELEGVDLVTKRVLGYSL